MLLRHVLVITRDAALFGFRSGRIWLPVPALVLVLIALLLGAVQTAVPTAVYVLF